MKVKKIIYNKVCLCFILAIFNIQPIFAQNTQSKLRYMVPAEALEQKGAQEYNNIISAAQKNNTLLSSNHALSIRVRNIAERIIPNAYSYNPRSKDWQWSVNLISDNQSNAFCLPGGKIAVYTGLINNLNATDDEIAVVVGHEIAHALQEHAREQTAKNSLTNMGVSVFAQALGLGELGRVAAGFGAQMLSLKFSRDDETDADLVGLQLMAKSGFDPRASVVLWQKMSAKGGANQPQWLSTHPIGKNRIKTLQAKIPSVMPIFSSINPVQAGKSYVTTSLPQ